MHLLLFSITQRCDTCMSPVFVRQQKTKQIFEIVIVVVASRCAVISEAGADENGWAKATTSTTTFDLRFFFFEHIFLSFRSHSISGSEAQIDKPFGMVRMYKNRRS